MQKVMNDNNKTYAWYYFGSNDGTLRVSLGVKFKR